MSVQASVCDVGRLTEISRIVICWAVEAQVLQVRDEVRNRALVDALALTQDVKLVGNTRYIVSDTLTL